MAAAVDLTASRAAVSSRWMMSRVSCLALLLCCTAACSSSPASTADASTADASTADESTVDASTTDVLAPGDVTVTDAPPGDAPSLDASDAGGPAAVRVACAEYCARVSSQCGGPAPLCEMGCVMAAATAVCAERLLAYARCASTGNFDCAGNHGPAACAALEAALAPCASGGSTGSPDAGTDPVCSSFCDRGLAECRTGTRVECLASCAAGLSSACGEQVRDVFVCAAASSGWQCAGANPFPPSCAGVAAALAACMGRPL